MRWAWARPGMIQWRYDFMGSVVECGLILWCCGIVAIMWLHANATGVTPGAHARDADRHEPEHTSLPVIFVTACFKL